MDNLKIKSFNGAEEIKAAYESMLEGKSLSILCLAENYQHVLGDWFDEEFAPKMYEQFKTREIIPDNEENRAFAKTKSSNNEVRFMNKDLKTGQSDMVVTDSKLMLVSFDERNPFAVVITDPELVKSAQAQFEIVWRSL